MRELASQGNKRQHFCLFTFSRSTQVDGIVTTGWLRPSSAATTFNGTPKREELAVLSQRKLCPMFVSKAMYTTPQETNLSASSRVTKPTTLRLTRDEH